MPRNSRDDGLQHLADLLRCRFGPDPRRAFVMLAVESEAITRINTDNVETQRIPILLL